MQTQYQGIPPPMAGSGFRYSPDSYRDQTCRSIPNAGEVFMTKSVRRTL